MQKIPQRHVHIRMHTRSTPHAQPLHYETVICVPPKPPHVGGGDALQIINETTYFDRLVIVIMLTLIS